MKILNVYNLLLPTIVAFSVVDNQCDQIWQNFATLM